MFTIKWTSTITGVTSESDKIYPRKRALHLIGFANMHFRNATHWAEEVSMEFMKHKKQEKPSDVFV